MKKHVAKHLFPRELDALDIKVGELKTFYKSNYERVTARGPSASRYQLARAQRSANCKQRH
jgi:hypothetical protein